MTFWSPSLCVCVDLSYLLLFVRLAEVYELNMKWYGSLNTRSNGQHFQLCLPKALGKDREI